MKTKTIRLTLLVLLLTALLASCAPPSSMIATLTLLPGTPTPRRTYPPTRTPRATNTLAPVQNRFATDTPIPPAECPTNAVDSAAPEDPSQLPGRHYDIRRLPQEFTLVDSGMFNEDGLGWVQVRWQGRSLFWTQRQVCQDAENQPYWEVVDVLALPRLDAKLGEAMTTLCYQGEKALPFAVAYGMYDPAQPASDQPNSVRGWSLQAQAAWEMQQGKFVPLSLSGLSCVVQEK